jgi:hypothetical protein
MNIVTVSKPIVKSWKSLKNNFINGNREWFSNPP